MQFDITCTAVVPHSSEKKVRTLKVNPRVLLYPEAGEFIVREMKCMMKVLESECDAAMKEVGVTLGDDGMKE